jgi:phosphoserine phosphatase RsbU/P
VWFRLHVKLAPNHGPLALLIAVPVSENTAFGLELTQLGSDVFVDGRNILPQGPNASQAQQYQQISRLYNLDIPPTETSLLIAVRTLYVPFGYGAYTGFFAGRTFSLGNPVDLQRELDQWSDKTLFERLPRLVYASLLVVLAIFLFALYFAQKGHNEYLWLALHELVQAPLGFIELAGSSARLDRLWYAALVLQLLFISGYLFFEFLVAFLSLRNRWYIKALRYTAPVLAGIGPVLLLVGHSSAVGVLLASIFVFSLLWLVGWSLFVFITLIVSAVRRNFEAALLLIPLVLGLIGVVEPVVTATMSEESGTTFHSPLTLQAGPIPIHFSSIADFAGIFVIVLIIFFRFLRIQSDRERATNELAAARSVQELLIPREKLPTPGFEVESVYNPAAEVGGDFFHVQRADGGMLIVIGDVAGKGLKAAMSVSMLMGALRRTQERSPAKVLESLNRVLAGTESFTTCQAVWFGANGEMVIANAGHLSPYLNSQELELPSGLPLGVLSQVSYDEARFFLHPGDRLLLMSDGVVEARAHSGELFGFERVRHFSQQTAFYIAEAAKSFGQQDDITVLTVRREAQAVAA